MFEPPANIMVQHVATNGREHLCAYRMGTADENVLMQIWQAVEYDLSVLPPDSRAAINHHRATIERPVIIDGGAHIGLAAVWFALTYPEAEVIAIEPQAGNFALLQRNTAGLPVNPVRAALGERIARGRVTDTGEGNWAYQVEPLTAGRFGTDDVMIFPITGFLEPGRSFIVKLDIEGAEAEVLRNPAWVEQVPVVILEQHAWADRSGLNSLYAEGRQVHQIGENIVSVLL